MKLTASRKALAGACKTASVPATSGHLAILGGLRLDAVKGSLSVVGTNLDLTIAADVDAEVAKPGTVILPGRLLSGVVDKAGGDTVTITVDKDQATIESASTVATLRTLSIDEWPKTQTAEGECFEFGPLDVERLSHVLHACETDFKKLGGRPALGGVHFVGERAEATDSYRLAVAHLGVSDLPSKVVPLDVLNRVTKASPKGLTVAFDSRSVTFDADDGRTTWTSTLIPAEFPAVERLIRKESPHQMTVHRATLIEALDRVRLFTDGDDTHPVDLLPEGDKLRLVATRTDVGDIRDEVDRTGDWDQPIRFHDRYLADLIKHHDGELITFELDDPLKPMQVRTSDWRLMMLLMPVRIG